MAIIPLYKCDKIAQELAKRKYNKQIDELVKELTLKMKEGTRRHMGEVWETFVSNKKYFKTEKYYYIRPDRDCFRSIVDDNLRSYSSRCDTMLDFNEPIPIWDGWFDEVADQECIRMGIEIFKLKANRNDLKKKIECLITESLRTENVLKKEFPEAYEVWMTIKYSTNNVCDNVENIRSKLNS